MVETGSHDELVAARGAYHQLVQRQLTKSGSTASLTMSRGEGGLWGGHCTASLTMSRGGGGVLIGGAARAAGQGGL